MGKTEMLRFDVDANTSGLWEQVKGDIHTRAGKMGNAGYLRIVSRVYLDLVRQDKGAIDRAVTRIKLEDGGYATR